MTEIKTKSAYDMLYLTSCALNNVIPDKNKIKSMNLENLFEMCQALLTISLLRFFDGR